MDATATAAAAAPMPPVPVIVWSIEGNIGAGKSTVLREIESLLRDRRQRCEADEEEESSSSSSFDIDILFEPIDDWCNVNHEGTVVNVFREYRDAPERRACEFQLFAFSDRLQRLSAKVAEARARLGATRPVVLICERSIESDRRIFADTQIKDTMGKCVYARAFDIFKNLFGDHMTRFRHVYLRVEPPACMDRIRTRARGGEESLDMDILHVLHDAHEQWATSDSLHVFQNHPSSDVEKATKSLALEIVDHIEIETTRLIELSTSL